VSGIRIITAGRALVKKGGYGALLGMPLSTGEEIEQEIAALASAGVGILKVVATGVVSLKQAGEITPGGFDGDALRAIVAAARRHGLAVMCHANGADAVREAVRAGVRSIEHGFYITEEVLAAMRDSGAFWVPTVGALDRAAASAGDAARARIARIIDGHLAMIRKAFALGVPLAVGTDCVLPDNRYAGHYQDELAYFRRSGIPDEAVDRIACEGGRELLAGSGDRG
jgi:imidazolonepropionase-like amidohydrolase